MINFSVDGYRTYFMKTDFFPSKSSINFGSLRDSRIVSNSESLDWVMCERRHYYHHVLLLESRESGLAQLRGTIGHLALAEFYTAVQDRKSKDVCHKAAIAPIDIALAQAILNQDYEVSNMLTHLKSLVIQYVMLHWADPIQVLEVETVHIVPTPVEGIHYGLKLDLLVEWIAPPNKGEVELWDHKFSYNFRSPAMMDLNPQLPRYMAALRSEGYPVTRARLNQIRYRPLKDPAPNQIFKRTPLITSDDRLARFAEEQFETSLRIRERTALPIATQDKLAVRVRTQSICEKCPFQKLCIAEDKHGSLRDNPTGQAADVKKYYYQPSQYGYNEIPEERDESDD